MFMRKPLDNLKEGICVGGELVQSFRYADGQDMTANTEKGLKKIIDEKNKVVKKYGMKRNIKNTKVLKIGRKPSTITITVGREILQQVEDFKHLGSIHSSSGSSEKNILVRIEIAKSAFNKLKKTTQRRIKTSGQKKIG